MPAVWIWFVPSRTMPTTGNWFGEPEAAVTVPRIVMAPPAASISVPESQTPTRVCRPSNSFRTYVRSATAAVPAEAPPNAMAPPLDWIVAPET